MTTKSKLASKDRSLSFGQNFYKQIWKPLAAQGKETDGLNTSSNIIFSNPEQADHDDFAYPNRT